MKLHRRYIPIPLVLAALAAAPAGTVPPATAPAVAPSPAPPAKPIPIDQLILELKGLAPAQPRTAEALAAEYARAIRALMDRMVERSFSRNRGEVRDDLEAICLRAGRAGAEAERLAACQALVAILAGPAPDATRGVPVHLLEYVGRAECVPALATLLAGKDEGVREEARRALAANSATEAGQELRKALLAAVGTEWRVALVNALSYRREEAAVEALAKLLKDPEPQVAVAAAAALGQIGTSRAVAALNDVRLLAVEPIRSAVADALFACAERLAADGDVAAATTIYRKAFENPAEPRTSRTVALRRLVAAQGERAVPLLAGLLAGEDEAILSVALELAREMPGEAATKAIADLLPKSKTLQRTLSLLALLAARADPAAREAVLEVMAGRDLSREDRQTVRLAGIRALGGVGNEQDVTLLLKLAGQTLKGKEEEQKLARASLRQLRGARINQVLIGGIGEADPAVRVEAIRALGSRAAVEAVAPLLNLVGDNAPAVRIAALDALGQVADVTAMGPMLKWLAAAKDSTEIYQAERAVGAVCDRVDDKDAAADLIAAAAKGAALPARLALIRICGRLTGPSALDFLAKAAEDPDEKVRDAAVRTMAQSPDMGAAQALVKVARTAASEDNRTAALRGYIRLMRYVEQPDEKKIWSFIQILDLAARPEEKKLAIAGLGDIKTLGAMKLTLEYLDSKDLRAEAEQTICRIARHLCTQQPQEVAQAMQRILSLTENADTAKEAKRLLELAKDALKAAPPKKP